MTKHITSTPKLWWLWVWMVVWFDLPYAVGGGRKHQEKNENQQDARDSWDWGESANQTAVTTSSLTSQDTCMTSSSKGVVYSLWYSHTITRKNSKKIKERCLKLKTATKRSKRSMTSSSLGIKPLQSVTHLQPASLHWSIHNIVEERVILLTCGQNDQLGVLGRKRKKEKQLFMCKRFYVYRLLWGLIWVLDLGGAGSDGPRRASFQTVARLNAC